ncbi:MAG: enoyl-CoA hydratase-related protein [Burkholderiaceae bacterium]
MTTEPVVLHDIDARGVATVRLNRPQVNNAYNGDMLEGLCEAVGALATNPDVRVIVIRGNGRHFQAGADLGWLQAVSRQDAAANVAASRLTANAVRGLNELGKPTIALVQGACVGGGTGVVAACDIVIAENSASFAISEVRWGVAATVIFPQLNDAIGIRQVRRYAQSCERFDAAEARRLGLVHEVCEPGELDAAAAPIIEGLLNAAPGALEITKQSAMQCAGALVEEEEFERLVAEHAARRQSDEASDGFASFHEKRKGKWYPAG